MNHKKTTKYGHAAVIGGSIAGFLAGRILADHFERVTIIERDVFPENPLPRKSAPQANHVHVLLMRGLQIFEQLFPGLRKELIEAGAHVIDTGADVAWLTPAGWGARFPSGLKKLAFSRPLLDWTIYRRLAALPNIRFIQEYDVARLLMSADGTVEGVSLNESPGAKEDHLHANLIVDATGRASCGPRWLRDAGYDAPEETIVNAHLGYSTRIYRRPSGSKLDWKAVFVQAAPPDHTRAGLLIPIEGDRWIVSAAGKDRDYPPGDEQGFMNFMVSLRSSIIFDSIKDAEPMSPIHTYRATENRLRHYERLSRLPEGIVFLGDSACAFNPVYAQGMTTAALGAMTLDKCLHEQRQRNPDSALTGLTRRFQRRLAKINTAPWMLATSEDYRCRGTEGGGATRFTRFMHRYTDTVIQLTTKDTAVRKLWLEVFHMLRSPSAMLRPRVLLKVLRKKFTLQPSRQGPETFHERLWSLRANKELES